MKPDQAGAVLKNFLQKPDRNFRNFFEICYRLTLGYLRYLKMRGWSLPTDESAGQQPLNDLAIDILGPFLRSTSEQSFVAIFGYFRNNGLSDFAQADTDMLYDLFKTLLFGYIKQELRRISHEANPQLENLKRRFEEILAGSLYKTYSSGKGAQEYICLADRNLEQRSYLPLISFEQLVGIVEQTYCASFSRSEWCRNIFSEINEMKTVRNCVRKGELIRAVVTTNVKHA